MSRWLTLARLSLAAMVTLWTGAVVAQQAPGTSRYGVGSPAEPHDIAARDLTVFPDGRGLPVGRGTVQDGRRIYSARCAACHGPNGEGTPTFPQLVGGRGTLHTDTPVLTVGSYWPYATTLWDYTRRAMPYQEPGTLTSSEVYSVTAFLLYANGIVSEDVVLDERTLPLVSMPNRDGFIGDARPDIKRRP